MGIYVLSFVVICWKSKRISFSECFIRMNFLRDTHVLSTFGCFKRYFQWQTSLFKKIYKRLKLGALNRFNTLLVFPSFFFLMCYRVRTVCFISNLVALPPFKAYIKQTLTWGPLSISFYYKQKQAHVNKNYEDDGILLNRNGSCSEIPFAFVSIMFSLKFQTDRKCTPCTNVFKSPSIINHRNRIWCWC